MLRQSLSAGILLAFSSTTWAAFCASSPSNMGTLVERTATSGPQNAFSATCTAVGDPAEDDLAAWSFSNRYNFTLARDANQINSFFSLNFVRTGQVDPSSPTPGEPFYMINTRSIWLEYEGVRSYIGGEGAGNNEVANLLAFDLKAGNYTLGIDGRVYDTPTNSGFYSGYLDVSYVPGNIAAPVPEPASAALLALGLPAVAWVARRKRAAAKVS